MEIASVIALPSASKPFLIILIPRLFVWSGVYGYGGGWQ
jgi:hypothetical protein